jgi:F-type H+-transporting ATPase subunit epsilon
MSQSMRLTIQLPSRIFLDQKKVIRVTAEAPAGKFGILPCRLDCLSALIPGILSYTTDDEREYHVAIDEGLLVKEAFEVRVSVYNAIGDVDLIRLRGVVEEQLKALEERELRQSLSLLQGRILGSLKGVSHERR